MDMKIEQSELDELVRAFQLMWGHYPEPAQLAYKDREIIALNAASESVGQVKGKKCSSCGTPEVHKGCLANQAISTQQPVFKKNNYGDREVVAYWMPVDGYPDLFVHFSIGAIIDYDKTLAAIPSVK